MARINLVQLRKELDAQEARIIAPKMKEVLNEKFKEEKANLLKEFDQHPVTQELNAGPNAESSFITTKSGGNLYSFLGFVQGIEPAKDLRRNLEIGISKGQVRKQVSSKNKIIYTLETRIPTIEELKRRGELLKWTTRSFIDIIEKGVNNFRRYLFDDSGRLSPYSRSGPAIQIKHDIKQGRPAQVKPIPYISKLIEDFKKNLRIFNKNK